MSNKKIFKKLYKNKINKQDNYKEILRKINIPNKKVSIFKKVLIPVCSLLIVLNILITNTTKKDSTFIENEEIYDKEYEIYINNSNKNNSTITNTFSSDNLSDTNNYQKLDTNYETLIKSKDYNFLNNLKIPDDLNIKEYKEVHQNNNSSSLKNYEFTYQNKTGRNIILTFSDKTETIKDESFNESSNNHLKVSKIKDTEIIIHQEESLYTSKFIYNNKYFYIKTTNIDKEELINLLLSIIN